MLCLCFHEWFHENVFQKKKVCSKCRRTQFDVIALFFFRKKTHTSYGTFCHHKTQAINQQPKYIQFLNDSNKNT